MEITKEKIDLAMLSCAQSKTDKVHVQIEFLVALKCEQLVAEQALANYRKTDASVRYKHAVWVDKIKFMEALNSAKEGVSVKPSGKQSKKVAQKAS